MLYINVDPDFPDHPKTKRLVGLLGRGAEILPIKLWCYCGKYHAENGRFVGYSPQEIESIVNWWGKTGEMVDAMVKVGFLKKCEDGDYEIHDWNDHEGHIIVLKERAQKAARIRWEKEKASSNATSNAQALLKQSSIPDHTIPDHKNNTKFDFEKLWEQYPNKTGKDEALKRFNKLVISEDDYRDIEIALKNYLQSRRVFNGFVMNGSKFFNQWKDWVKYTEPVCPKCKGKGKYVSSTGWESVCDCPAGKRLK